MGQVSEVTCGFFHKDVQNTVSYGVWSQKQLSNGASQYISKEVNMCSFYRREMDEATCPDHQQASDKIKETF